MGQILHGSATTTEAVRRAIQHCQESIMALADQNPRVEAREALNLLESVVRELPLEVHPPRLQVIFKENIPEH